jgi:hypothetical protein
MLPCGVRTFLQSFLQRSSTATGKDLLPFCGRYKRKNRLRVFTGMKRIKAIN